jgi:PadR family transcriptional regulator, regulatory protein AphA
MCAACCRACTPSPRKAATRWPRGWPSRAPGRCWSARPLVKVAYADQGTRDGLLANLAALIDDTAAKLHFGQMIAGAYLQGRGPFPDRLPLSGLMWRFLREYHVTVLRWAQAQAQVQAWPEDLSQLDATAEFSRIVSAASSPSAGQ